MTLHGCRRLPAIGPYNMAVRSREGRHGAHASNKAARARRWPRSTLFVVALVVVVAAAGGGAAFALSRSGGASAQQPHTATTRPAGPFTVASTTPTAGATGVDPGATLAVTLSQPLAANSPLPTLSPPVAGTWTKVTPTHLQFSATAPFVPSTTETLSIPGGSGGLRSSGGQTLPSTLTSSFTVAAGSTLRLQQILGQLGYLPVQFTPTGTTAPQDEADPQPGSFSWRWSTLPAALTSQWSQGTDNVITKGAVMAFEDQHQLGVDGDAGPHVWAALLAALQQNQASTASYNYVLVSTTLPQTVTVYENGAPSYNTRANTGVPGAPTALGTFPVYLRYTTTTMSGTNPDGSTYSDPGIPWVSYFNGGDALHGFVRPGYGYPQSDGCVEMPISNAQVVYPLTPLGTLVTVQ
jgi:lipoprotein-anchoring transpeptidase ErfK/SrfK